MKKVIKKEVLKEKEITPPVLLSKHPNYSLRNNESFVSFRMDERTGLVHSSSSSGTKGCHGYVRTQKFGPGSNIRLGILTQYYGMPFSVEEIEKYVELLATMGFDIKYEKLMTSAEMKINYTKLYSDYGILNSGAKDCMVFSLGENYKNNVASIRYIALCLLRYLFMQHTQWIPRKFLDYYNYFKKKRLKPSLDKILIFANCSPAEDLYTVAESRTYYSRYGFTSSQSCLYYGYYNFIGTVSNQVKTGTMLSTLLATPNNFNIVKFMENHPVNNGNSAVLTMFGRVRMLNDNFQVEKELKILLDQQEYHKAYLYLKDKAVKVAKFTKDPFIGEKINLTLNDCLSHTALNQQVNLTASQLKELLQ